MSQGGLTLLLAVLGGILVATSWRGRRTGDAARDVWLMFSIGSCMFAGALGLRVVG